MKKHRGYVGVTLITPEGEVYKMCRDAVSLSHFVKNPKFYNKDSQYIREYVEGWLKMKTDWELNASNGSFMYEQTENCFPHNTISPVDYGMVVLDMQKDCIYTSQNYCHFDFLFLPANPTNYILPTCKQDGVNWNALKEENRLFETKVTHNGHFLNGSIDVSPFVIKNYEAGHSGLSTMFEEIKKEYSLSIEEVSLWEEFIDELKAVELELIEV